MRVVHRAFKTKEGYKVTTGEIFEGWWQPILFEVFDEITGRTLKYWLSDEDARAIQTQKYEKLKEDNELLKRTISRELKPRGYTKNVNNPRWQKGKAD